ncbi:MAG: EAL domain-containing protein [Firmicutes bacterium]|nr:EAL domain-containing protein [Bacillota bacterium]
MEDCSACSLDLQSGYRIDFPNRHSCEQIASTMLLSGSEQLVRVSDHALWMPERLFLDHVDYWEAHCEPSAWKVRHVQRQDGGLSSDVLGTALTWHEGTAKRAETWVYELIARDRIKMMFQPIVNVQDDSSLTIGYEMLARGMDADGQWIAPAKLFAAAREQNQMFRLDRACRFAAIDAASSLPATASVFVNFIPTSIYVPEHCLATTMAAVQRIGLRPEQLVFEVVETERVEDLAHLKRILRFYRERGFRYALDDVGQGFNDLDTLRALEPDVVKLDREWVTEIHLDREKRAVAEHVLKVSLGMGAVPLAEGVESAQEAHVLRELGYTWQQGYYYGRPTFHPELLPSV